VKTVFNIVIGGYLLTLVFPVIRSHDRKVAINYYYYYFVFVLVQASPCLGIISLVLSINLIPVPLTCLFMLLPHLLTLSSISPSLSFPPQDLPGTFFTNLSHYRLSSSLRTDCTDFMTGPFLLSVSVFTVRCSYASAVVGVVILSVCHMRALWLIQRTYRRCFLYRMKGQSFKFSAAQQWLVGDVPFHLKWAIEVTHPLQKSLTSTDFCL